MFLTFWGRYPTFVVFVTQSRRNSVRGCTFWGIRKKSFSWQRMLNVLNRQRFFFTTEKKILVILQNYFKNFADCLNDQFPGDESSFLPKFLISQTAFFPQFRFPQNILSKWKLREGKKLFFFSKGVANLRQTSRETYQEHFSKFTSCLTSIHAIFIQFSWWEKCKSLLTHKRYYLERHSCSDRSNKETKFTPSASFTLKINIKPLSSLKKMIFSGRYLVSNDAEINEENITSVVKRTWKTSK